MFLLCPLTLQHQNTDTVVTAGFKKYSKFVILIIDNMSVLPIRSEKCCQGENDQVSFIFIAQIRKPMFPQWTKFLH